MLLICAIPMSTVPLVLRPKAQGRKSDSTFNTARSKRGSMRWCCAAAGMQRSGDCTAWGGAMLGLIWAWTGAHDAAMAPARKRNQRIDIFETINIHKVEIQRHYELFGINFVGF